MSPAWAPVGIVPWTVPSSTLRPSIDFSRRSLVGTGRQIWQVSEGRRISRFGSLKTSHVVTTVGSEWLALLLLGRPSAARRTARDQACSYDARTPALHGSKASEDMGKEPSPERAVAFAHVFRSPTCHVLPANAARGPRIVSFQGLQGCRFTDRCLAARESLGFEE